MKTPDNVNKPYDIGDDHKLMFDEDEDLMWWHPSTEHEDWQYLDRWGIHRLLGGDSDDMPSITIQEKVVCSVVTCGVQGYITKGKWKSA